MTKKTRKPAKFIPLDGCVLCGQGLKKRHDHVIERPGPPAPPQETDLAANGLTRRERRFVLEYLVDLNATRAAIRAGYSARTARSIGSENLTKPDIRGFVDAVLEERAKETKLQVSDVLRGLARIAKADPARLVDETGKPLPLHEIPEDVRLAISGIEIEELFEGRGRDRTLVGFLHKYKFGSKNEAWRDLGRYLKMFTDVIEDRTAQLTDEEREARIAAIIDAAAARRKKKAGGG